jgi:hypothetical protein
MELRAVDYLRRFPARGAIAQRVGAYPRAMEVALTAAPVT